ncbi:MAG: DNA lyase [Methanobacterium sp.]|uniref:DNA glycosylase n=1 Tax=Methanobacterium sp. TaxID=2164 RepID=UPI003D65A195|nr:DNA lyase [Methanobacterium sp.]
MKTRIKIENDEYKGPFDIELTIGSGQTSQPAWKKKDDYFQELITVDNKPCLVKIAHKPNSNDPIDILAQSPQDIDDERIKTEIMDIFGLNDDIPQLYDFLRDDPQLEPTIDFCKGLRLFKANNIFESVICSITSAHNSIRQWNKAINLVKEKWGDEYMFPDGTFYLFPSPQKLAKAPEQEFDEETCNAELLKSKSSWNDLRSCRVGYRSKYIKKTSDMVQNEINLSSIGNMDYESAFQTILELQGVGPKVADCILLYGYGFKKAFPVDIWISRIVSHLYFDKEVNNTKIRLFGMEQFGDYAGYTQLYLFHYARKSGLMNELKPKK